MAEQAPLRIFQAVLESIGVAVRAAGAEPGEIALVSFSAAMHSVIALDAQNTLLTNSITWADNRAAGWAKKIHEEFDGPLPFIAVPARRCIRCRRLAN